MPIRDPLLTLVIFALLPVCVWRPWIGVLVWSWIGYMNPHRLTWGFAYYIPFAKFVAIATLAGLLAARDRQPLPHSAEVILMLVLWCVFLASTLGAIDPDEAWIEFDRVTKIFLMTFVTLVFFQDRRRLHVLIWVIALSIGFYGLKGGVWSILTGGQNRVFGPADSFLGDNTDLGLALNMTLPMFLFLRTHDTRRWVRAGLLALFGFSIVAILVTYSRGALIGLLAVLAILGLKSRLKLLAVTLAVVAVPLALAVLPDEWQERMQTISTYDRDASAMSRFEAWNVAYQLASDHPLLGGGFRPFTRQIWLHYTGRESGLDAHSIFFQVLGEHGFTGAGLYVALILCTLISLRRVIRRTAGSPDQAWIHGCADMTESSLIAFVVCGSFLSRSYFDLLYHLIAITVILKALLAREATPVPTPALVARRRALAAMPAPQGVGARFASSRSLRAPVERGGSFQ